MNDTLTGLELRSTVTSKGRLQLDLVEIAMDPPGADEVIIRVEATPINPSDLGLLLGPADMSTLHVSGTSERPILTAEISVEGMARMAGRLDRSMAVGNEGAGTVVRAGRNVSALLGQKVAALAGGMYTQFRKLAASDCVPLPLDATAADGASMFVNPLTALAFTETMKAEGHTALVHTAAASSLGQILNKICLADSIPLVNIVRSDSQADILSAIGAKIIVDSSRADFDAHLADAVDDTGATIAFDAIGGGALAGRILHAMEVAAGRSAGAYSPYGSTTFKQVYIYGGLDTGPTILDRTFGFAWAVGAWLVTPFLQKAGRETAMRLRQRILSELSTTFASRYAATISLSEALKPEFVAAYQRKTTGEKYLINPSLRL